MIWHVAFPAYLLLEDMDTHKTNFAPNWHMLHMGAMLRVC